MLKRITVIAIFVLFFVGLSSCRTKKNAGCVYTKLDTTEQTQDIVCID